MKTETGISSIPAPVDILQLRIYLSAPKRGGDECCWATGDLVAQQATGCQAGRSPLRVTRCMRL